MVAAGFVGYPPPTMAAYTVTMRIDGVRPQRAGPSVRGRRSPIRPPLDEGRDTIDLVGRPPGQGLAERWARFREAWAQTTFFLFDAESWR